MPKPEAIARQMAAAPKPETPEAAPAAPAAVLDPTTTTDATAAQTTPGTADARIEQPTEPAAQERRIIQDKPKKQIEAESRLATLIASGKRAALGVISFTIPEPERTMARDTGDGGKLRLVAQGFVALNPTLAPNLLTPINVYRRAEPNAKTFTTTIGFVGVAAGRSFRSYFATPTGKPADVTPAAAAIMEIVRAEYDVWSFSPDAKLPPLTEVIARQQQRREEAADGSIDEM